MESEGRGRDVKNFIVCEHEDKVFSSLYNLFGSVGRMEGGGGGMEGGRREENGDKVCYKVTTKREAVQGVRKKRKPGQENLLGLFAYLSS
jgi:hypothetical protein